MSAPAGPPAPESKRSLPAIGPPRSNILFTGLEDHACFVPTPNVANETNRADGVPLDGDTIRAGINYKFGAL
jgi:hypothetical protein